MKFLSERIKDEAFYCFVFNRIRSNVTTYAREYIDRFLAMMRVPDYRGRLFGEISVLPYVGTQDEMAVVFADPDLRSKTSKLVAELELDRHAGGDEPVAVRMRQLGEEAVGDIIVIGQGSPKVHDASCTVSYVTPCVR